MKNIQNEKNENKNKNQKDYVEGKRADSMPHAVCVQLLRTWTRHNSPKITPVFDVGPRFGKYSSSASI